MMVPKKRPAEEATLWKVIKTEWARDARDAAHAEYERLSAEYERLDAYSEKLFEKQPKELMNKIRRARLERVQANWREIKTYMRDQIQKGCGTEEIITKTLAKFRGRDRFDYGRSSLLRRGLNGLRKIQRNKTQEGR